MIAGPAEPLPASAASRVWLERLITDWLLEARGVGAPSEQSTVLRGRTLGGSRSPSAYCHPTQKRTHSCSRPLPFLETGRLVNRALDIALSHSYTAARLQQSVGAMFEGSKDQ